jgi:uncharacterized protein
MRPLGRPAFDLQVVTLGIDELEALRLADLEGLYQEAASQRMGVSRPTFARVLSRARATVIDALVNEKLLLVAGGPVVEAESEGPGCPVHWGGRRRGRGCHCPHRHEGDPRVETNEVDRRSIGAPEGETNVE